MGIKTVNQKLIELLLLLLKIRQLPFCGVKPSAQSGRGGGGDDEDDDVRDGFVTDGVEFAVVDVVVDAASPVTCDDEDWVPVNGCCDGDCVTSVLVADVGQFSDMDTTLPSGHVFVCDLVL